MLLVLSAGFVGMTGDAVGSTDGSAGSTGAIGVVGDTGMDGATIRFVGDAAIASLSIPWVS